MLRTGKGADLDAVSSVSMSREMGLTRRPAIPKSFRPTPLKLPSAGYEQ
jgi:hypothetical protein